LLGLVQWLAGREEEAVIALRRSLRLERTHLEALRLLAEIYNHQGRHAKARQTWTRLLRLRPDDEKAWQALQRQNEKPSFRGDSDAKDARV
jgi:cytochrome c-type biogenesis protein CcmH/NrfG